MRGTSLLGFGSLALFGCSLAFDLESYDRGGQNSGGSSSSEVGGAGGGGAGGMAGGGLGAGGAQGGMGGQLECGEFINPPVSSVQATFDGGLGDLLPHSCVVADGGSALFPLPEPPALDFCWVELPGVFHLTCDSLSFRLLEATNSILGAQTYVYLNDPSTGAEANLILEGGGFQFAGNGNAMEFSDSSYNPNADRYLRVRADETLMYFETSTDGSSWTTRGSSEFLIPLENLSIRIGAGSYDAIESSPGQARIDCINSVPCP